MRTVQLSYDLGIHRLRVSLARRSCDARQQLHSSYIQQLVKLAHAYIGKAVV